MRIGLDSTPLTVPTGGIRRYVEEMVCALAGGFPEDEFWLLTDQAVEARTGAWSNVRIAPRPRNVLTRRWWSVGLPLEILRRGIDVFHGADFGAPYLPLRPSVLTLHDLTPWLAREWHSGAGRVRSRTPLLVGLNLATMSIVHSEAVRRQAMERFRIPPGRIVAVPLAAAARFRPCRAAARERPYLLYVGTLEPRKNLNTVIAAWREVRGGIPVDLILAGRQRADFIPPRPEPGLELAGPIEDEDLPALYSGCAAFLYPSLCEGFGLPVLEAMQCGAPVIVSGDPAIAEVSADAALRVEASDARAWAEAMRVALSNESWRQERGEKSLKRARDFGWEKTARRTMEVYVEAIRRFGQ